MDGLMDGHPWVGKLWIMSALCFFLVSILALSWMDELSVESELGNF
jgi:hypothetical protein